LRAHVPANNEISARRYNAKVIGCYALRSDKTGEQRRITTAAIQRGAVLGRELEPNLIHPVPQVISDRVARVVEVNHGAFKR
jgi:hypothetical protein